MLRTLVITELWALELKLSLLDKKFIHWILPSFFSWMIPPNIKTATTKGREREIHWDSCTKETTGNISESSTSKIRKIITNKKYRVVKGDRDPTKGSKPHSNGVYFSVLEIPLAIKPSKRSKIEITKGIKIIAILRGPSSLYSKRICLPQIRKKKALGPA